MMGVLRIRGREGREGRGEGTEREGRGISRQSQGE